jgi:hypothetical protein
MHLNNDFLKSFWYTSEWRISLLRFPNFLWDHAPNLHRSLLCDKQCIQIPLPIFSRYFSFFIDGGWHFCWRGLNMIFRFDIGTVQTDVFGFFSFWYKCWTLSDGGLCETLVLERFVGFYCLLKEGENLHQCSFAYFYYIMF